MTYHNAIKYILTSPDKNGAASSLERIRLISARLGSPHKNVKYIRFAGSNGKTVCQLMLSNILKESGISTGSLIMPALSEPRENILIGGEPLSMSDIVEYVSRIVAAVNGLREELLLSKAQSDPESTDESAHVSIALKESELVPTKNEIILLVALLAFKEKNCSLCLIECEHNGADPTKLLTSPLCAAICGTIPSEATKEVQRIRSYIRSGVPEIVSAPQNSETYKIISDACAQANCRMSMPARSALDIKRLSLSGSEFSYREQRYTLGVCGRFQVHNATTVIETVRILRRLGFDISDEAVRSGLRRVSMRSHFEVISVNPTVIIDSTHKAEAVDTMCRSLADFKAQTNDKLTLCISADLPLIRAYLSSLTSIGYDIERIFIPRAPESILGELSDVEAEIVCPPTYKSAAKQLLSQGGSTLVSGTLDAANALRTEILRILEF